MLISPQSKLVLQFQQCNIFELLLTLASNAADDPLFNSWNTLLLETFYLCFRSVKPSTLVIDQAKSTRNQLASLLDAEDKFRANLKRTAPTRHSRFGTSIAVKSVSLVSLVHCKDTASDMNPFRRELVITGSCIGRQRLRARQAVCSIC